MKNVTEIKNEIKAALLNREYNADVEITDNLKFWALDDYYWHNNQSYHCIRLSLKVKNWVYEEPEIDMYYGDWSFDGEDLIQYDIYDNHIPFPTFTVDNWSDEKFEMFAEQIIKIGENVDYILEFYSKNLPKLEKAIKAKDDVEIDNLSEILYKEREDKIVNEIKKLSDIILK